MRLQNKVSFLRTRAEHMHSPESKFLPAASVTALLLIVLCMPAAVKADQYGDFMYLSDGTNATVTGYTGTSPVVVIPDTLNNLRVTALRSSAFEYGRFASITFPNSVVEIGDGAFRNCLNLTNVALAEGLASIGASAFQSCTRLAQLTLPNSLTNIGSYAFDSTALINLVIPANVVCIGLNALDGSSLSTIAVDSANANFSSLDGVLFDKARFALLRCPAARLGSYAIPGTVTTVGTNAFSYCTKLSSITIPGSVTNIADWAFAKCSALHGITIPDSVTRLGDYAFWYATSLTDVTIPEGVTSIGASGFFMCTSLAHVVIPNGVTSIGDSAFFDCTKLTDLSLPASLTKIGSESFYYCTGLTNLTLPAGLTSLGSSAFEYCGSLTNVTIPITVTNLGSYAFAYCTNLTAVYCRGDAPSLGSNVFPLGKATVYYLPGTGGWHSTLGGLPTALWFLPNPLILSYGATFGVQSNCFGFTISWATNADVAVEACTNLAGPLWCPLATNSLTAGASYFSDSGWTNYPVRFYRLRSL